MDIFDLSTQKLESLCRQINYECTQISSRSQILFPAKGLISAQKNYRKLIIKP